MFALPSLFSVMFYVILSIQVPFCSSHGDLVDTHGLPGFDSLKGNSIQVQQFCAWSEVMVLKYLNQVDCAVVVGYQAVYRLCLIVTLFFTLMSLLMIGVKSSSDPRAGIQNGFWGFKWVTCPHRLLDSRASQDWIPSKGTFWSLVAWSAASGFQTEALARFVTLMSVIFTGVVVLGRCKNIFTRTTFTGVDVFWHDWWLPLHPHPAGSHHRLRPLLGRSLVCKWALKAKNFFLSENGIRYPVSAQV